MLRRGKQAEVRPFKFNVDMVASAKAVKENGDESFTLGDLLDIYYEKRNYVKYDKSALQWNKFVKDFCADDRSIHTSCLKNTKIVSRFNFSFICKHRIYKIQVHKESPILRLHPSYDFLLEGSSLRLLAPIPYLPLHPHPEYHSQIQL